MTQSILQKYIDSIAHLDELRCAGICQYNESLYEDRLDDIWYNEMSEEDRKAANEYFTIKSIKRTNKMKNVFDTKEQYLAFSARWKEIAADLKSKKTVIGTNYAYNTTTRKYDIINQHTKSQLNYKFHAIFLAATGKLPTGMKKLDPLHEVLWNLDNGSNWYSDVYRAFGDTLTDEQVKKIHENLTLYVKVSKSQ